MGYYGLGPGMRVADQLTPLEKTLRAIPTELAQQVLDILVTLCKNIAQKPGEEKFRKIKLGNAKIIASVTSVQAAVQALMILGFEYQEEDDMLILPTSVKFNFPNHINPIIDAEVFHRKENEKLRVAKGLGRVAPVGEKPEDPRSAEEISTAATQNLEWARQVKKIQV